MILYIVDSASVLKRWVNPPGQLIVSFRTRYSHSRFRVSTTSGAHPLRSITSTLDLIVVIGSTFRMGMARSVHWKFPRNTDYTLKDDLQDTDPDISEISTFTVSRDEQYSRDNT